MSTFTQVKSSLAKGQAPLRAFTAVPSKPARRTVSVSAQLDTPTVGFDRRQVLQGVLATSLIIATPAAQAAEKAPKGFNPVQDLNDGYQFLYPFGWQEVTVKGADVVYKDVVEPLESVSVTIVGTDKNDITEYGDVQEVCETLAKSVLTAPGQEVKVLGTTQRDYKGRNYYEVEFTAANSRYTRHQLAVVAVADGKFFTLTTGASEKRWGKMKDKLETTVRSFQLLV